MSSENPKSRISLAETPALVTEHPPRALSGWAALVAFAVLLVVGIASSAAACRSDSTEPAHPARSSASGWRSWRLRLPAREA